MKLDMVLTFIACAILVLLAYVIGGKGRSPLQRIQDLENRVSALEKVIDVSIKNP